MARFLNGGEVEVYLVEGIVNYARACLGDGGYNLIFNNCEHFANACTLGKYRSRQVEGVFKMGIFGKIGDWIGSIFGGGSSSSGSRSTTSYDYNYEPDKVRIVEIERDTKLNLADKETERIELMRDSQIEFVKT